MSNRSHLSHLKTEYVEMFWNILEFRKCKIQQLLLWAALPSWSIFLLIILRWDTDVATLGSAQDTNLMIIFIIIVAIIVILNTNLLNRYSSVPARRKSSAHAGLQCCLLPTY